MQCNKSSISTGYNLNILLNFFFLQQRKTTQLNLQKDVIPAQKQPSCKRGCSSICKIASVKKVVKYRWWPRNGSIGRPGTNISITTIQVNYVSIPSETEMRQHKIT